MRAILSYILLACCAHGQLLTLGAGKGASGGGPPTNSRIHLTQSNATCSPSCSITIPSTTAGDLLAVAFSTSTGAATHISSVTGAGTWTAAGACIGSETTAGSFTDLAYNASATGGVASVTITLSGSDPSPDIWVAEYTGGSAYALDGTCAAISNPSASLTGLTGSMSVTSTNDVIVSVIGPAHAICTGVTVSNVSGTGVTTPITDVGVNTDSGLVDYLNAPTGTDQASVPLIQGTCPGSPTSQVYESSTLAFKNH